MKKISLEYLFCGYNDVQFQENLDRSVKLEPTLSISDHNEDKILFLTDKVNVQQAPFDPSELKSLPGAIVASYKRVILNDACPVIRVKDVRAALSYALSNLYSIRYDKLKFIAVTGTNGKTTTATLIYEILKRCGYKCGFIGTGKILSTDRTLSVEHYSMTTPDPTLLYPSIAKMQDDGCEYIVMEASSHSIALGKIAPITFEYAIFTNLDNDHLDFHKSIDNYYSTKVSLFERSKRGLFNADDKYAREAMKAVMCKTASFGVLYQGDAFATDIISDDLLGTSFIYHEKDIIIKIKTKLIGSFNVYNALAALKCVIDLGIKPCIAKEALENIQGVDGRMQIIDSDVKVVIDYAHTPMAFASCLKALKKGLCSDARLITVFGCGGDRDRSKRPIMGKTAAEISDVVIITEDNNRSENFSDIAKDIASGIKDSAFEIIPDRESAIRYALDIAEENDIVAVIGKGHERYKIENGKIIPFDEKELITDALMKRKMRK